MNRNRVLATIAAGLIGLASAAGSRQPAAEAAAPARVSPTNRVPRIAGLSRLPLAFEENCGQTDERVRFVARAKGLTAFVTPSETVLALHARRADSDDLATDVVRMRFVGANEAPRVEGREALPGKCNYFLGSDPSRWVTDAPTCARVVLRDVYPGVDQHWCGGGDGRLRYELALAPGADPSAIAFVLVGARDLVVEDDGALSAKTDLGELRQDAPFAYQTVDGVRRRVAAAFVASANGSVRFDVGAHDRGLPLVIDPALTYSTYLGGSGQDYAWAIAVDSSGAAYVSGDTKSADFPTQSPYQSLSGTRDAFITKIDASGAAMVYSTYLGGSTDEYGFAIAVDSFGAAYVTGRTTSNDLPTVCPFQSTHGGGGAHWDVFVSKIGASGSTLVYSTYLGGSGDELAKGIAVDPSGAAYVTGDTGSTNFPTQSALQAAAGGGSDAFVTKLATSGATLVFSTYLGGTGGDHGNGIATDSSGAAYVTGKTNSSDFPTQSSLQSVRSGPEDAFVAKINSSGSALVYATYLGGAAADEGTGVAVDANGAAYVCGVSESSSDFPTTAAFQSTFGGGTNDGFVAKLGSAGSSLVWSTYLGGSGVDFLIGIVVGSDRAPCVVGSTSSSNFPIASPAQASKAASSTGDAVVVKLDSQGTALVFSTYLGGSRGAGGRGIALDSTGAAYVCGFTGSTDFPLQAALQGAFGGGIQADGFVSKYPLTLGGSAVPPPASPTNLSATYTVATGVTLTWTDNSVDEAGFRVERHPTGFYYGLLATAGANVTSATDEALYPKTTYTYRVRAFDAAGNSAWSNEATITTSEGTPVPAVPRAPTHLVATPDQGLDENPVVYLGWTDNSADETNFDLERVVGGAPSGRAAVTRADVTGAVDEPVHPGWPYAYRVRALSLQGPSPWSNAAVATTPATIDVSVVSGKLTDSRKPRLDTLKLSATYAFPATAPAGAAFDPVANGLDLQLGAANAPLSVSIALGDATWKWKGKAKKRAPTRATWTSPKGALPKVTIVVNLVRQTLKATVTGADFTAAPTPFVRVLIASGADGGGHQATWTEGKAGQFRLE